MVWALIILLAQALLLVGARAWYYRRLSALYREGYERECEYSDMWRRECFRLIGREDLYEQVAMPNWKPERHNELN